MQIEDQSGIIDFLSDQDAYAGLGLRGPVKRIETHISVVFLIADRAFKLKRAVRFPYLDFSDGEKRKAAAEVELALNRRTAPELYLGLAPLVREAGGALRLGGIGAAPSHAAEWLVAMRRFRQRDLFERMAVEGRLDPRLMEPLAERIASFHEGAEIHRDRGGLAGMRYAAGTVREALAEIPPGIFDAGALASFTGATGASIDRLAPLLEDRRRAGLCRHCHGDLHLRNIALVEGLPTLFDCIEFSEEIAVIDVLYDLAFLLMDLWHRGLAGHADIVLNRYLQVAGPKDGEDAFAGLAALPLFLSSRAAIRAHVTASMAGAAGGPAAGKALAGKARAYLDLALRLLAPPAPRLIAIGGLPGTGKTTLARALAPLAPPAPGAILLRSDVIRKELAGVDPLTRLGPEGYTKAMTRRTYKTMLARAGAVLASGHSAIVDAVSARPRDRAEIEAVARHHRAGFTGLWLEAPLKTLEDRISRRRADASDATAELVRDAGRFGVGEIAWPRIDASLGAGRVAELAREAVGNMASP
ncbi:MAG: bifunctional aminoglycoside phosphotransferase/ATP-binding protein [Alphaproteobacteria bacterium]